MSRMVKMRDQMKLLNSNSGFDNCVNLPSFNTKTVSTTYGEFFFGSSLSYQLQPLPFDLEIVTDIEKFESFVYTYEDFVDLPLRFFVPESDMIPSDWSLDDLEREYISSITLTNDSCKRLEKDTVGHSESKLWVFSVARKINASNSHKVFIRKKNFETLVPSFLDEEPKKVLPSTKENTKHEKMYIPIARDLYENILKFNLNRNADVRETGCVIQPLLPWLVASPDGLISDRSKPKENVGLVEIKCPKTKHSCTYDELLADESFYIGKCKEKLILKKEHSYGYYTQIQMAMGLAGVTYCDFVVYTLKCMIIIRVPFDQKYFFDLVDKLNQFYKTCLLPQIVVSMPFSNKDIL